MGNDTFIISWMWKPKRQEGIYSFISSSTWWYSSELVVVCIRRCVGAGERSKERVILSSLLLLCLYFCHTHSFGRSPPLLCRSIKQELCAGGRRLAGQKHQLCYKNYVNVLKWSLFGNNHFVLRRTGFFGLLGFLCVCLFLLPTFILTWVLQIKMVRPGAKCRRWVLC